jgi:hypothetical protein
MKNPLLVLMVGIGGWYFYFWQNQYQKYNHANHQ